MINEIIQTLLSEKENPVIDGCIGKVDLPFYDGQFKLELHIADYEKFGIIIKHGSEIIGFNEFNGPTNTGPRYSDTNLPSFYGFESHIGSLYPSMIEGEDATSLALFVKKAYRERFSGIGKTIISTSLGIMKELMSRRHVFDENKPLYIAQCCSTTIFMKHYQGISTDYYSEFNDVMVMGSVSPPILDIRKK